MNLIRVLDTGRRFIRCIKFSKDGRYLAVGFFRGGATNIYDLQTGEKTCTLRDANDGKDISIYKVCFSPNGLYLATWGSDNLVRVWEISKRHVRNVLGSLSLTCIDFSPDGRLIAAGTSEGGSLEIRNWRDGSRTIFKELESDVHDVRFSPDGKYIAVGVDSDVLLWNVRTGRLVEKLMGHCGRVYSVAFTPGGTGLVSGSKDQTAKFWDIGLLRMGGPGQERVSNFREHTSPVFFTAVSSDSRWVVSCSTDEICIWDACNAELHCELKRQNNDVWFRMDFSPVGGFLACAFERGGQVLLWRFTETVPD